MSTENRHLKAINSMIENDKIIKKMRSIQSRAKFMLCKGVITEEEYIQILNRTSIDIFDKVDYSCEEADDF